MSKIYVNIILRKHSLLTLSPKRRKTRKLLLQVRRHLQQNKQSSPQLKKIPPRRHQRRKNPPKQRNQQTQKNLPKRMVHQQRKHLLTPILMLRKRLRSPLQVSHNKILSTLVGSYKAHINENGGGGGWACALCYLLK